MLQDCYDKLKAREGCIARGPPQQCAEKKDFDKCFEKFDRACMPQLYPKQHLSNSPLMIQLMSPQKSFTLNPEAAMARVGRKGKHSRPI
jgi:hypothetical protein